MKLIPNAQSAPSPIEWDDDVLEVKPSLKTRVSASKVGTCAKRGVSALSKRYRLRFSFWLDMLKSDEVMVADQIELLKNSRLFSATVRDGIMLMCDLRQGSTDLLTRLFPILTEPLALWNELQNCRADMLLRMFPWLKEAIAPPAADTTAMQKQIDMLYDLIKAKAPAGEGAPIKMLTNNKATPPPPDDDDDALTAVRDESAGAKSASNFLKSAFALNGMEYKS